MGLQKPRLLTKRSDEALRARFGACGRAIAPSRISNDNAVGAWPEHRTATLAPERKSRNAFGATATSQTREAQTEGADQPGERS